MTVLKRKTLTLVVTQSCNLNCAYCYQSHKSKQFMTMDIAKSAIDKQINNAGAYDEIEIDLFGGEAFVRPDFIIELCEWTWNQNYNIPMIFFWGIHFTQVAPIGCGFESCSPERSPRSTCKWLALQPLPAGRVGKTACPGGASSDG